MSQYISFCDLVKIIKKVLQNVFKSVILKITIKRVMVVMFCLVSVYIILY